MKSKLRLLFFAIVAFLIYDTYYNWKIIRFIYHNKRYVYMLSIALSALWFYSILDQNPQQYYDFLSATVNLLHVSPVDRNSTELVNAITRLTKPILSTNDINYNNSNNINNINNNNISGTDNISNDTSSSYFNDIGDRNKRSVSNIKKKYVASQQGWKCASCNQTLSAWFEVDHRIRLDRGGSNDVSNLMALCRECHGRKTAMESM